jgi:hypothetical protein
MRHPPPERISKAKRSSSPAVVPSPLQSASATACIMPSVASPSLPVPPPRISAMKQFTFPSNSQPPVSSSSGSRPPTAAASPSLPLRPHSSHGSASRPATPLARSASPLDLEAVNARVEKKFAYWKAFWSSVHQQQSASAQHEEKTQTSSGGGAGLGGLSREEAVDSQGDMGKREQIDDVIRRMRAVREEEMADTGRRRRGRSEGSAKQQQQPASAQEKTASAAAAAGAGSGSGLHSRGWDASSKLRQQGRQQQLHRQSTAPHRQHGRSSPSLSPPAYSSSPSASSSSSSASSASPSRPSNLARFWSEERSRPSHRQQPLSSAGRAGASGRKLSHLTLPEDAAEARQLWEAMKEEMWSHWEAVQQREEQKQREQESRDDDSEDEDEEEAERRRRISSRFYARATSPLPTPLPFSPLHAAASSPPSLYPQQQQPAFPSSGFRSPPSLSSFASFSSRPTPLSPPAALPLSGWSIAALRAEMSRLSLPTAHILEKGEMVAAITASLQQQQEAALRAQKEETVVRELQRWAQGRTLVQLLNSLNQAEAGAAVLTASSSAAEVCRCYKRTLLRVHPDKSPQANWEVKLRATELFKLLHDKYREFNGSSSGA